MKDYVIKVADVVLWRVALRAEAEGGSEYAYIDDEDEVKVNLPVTGIVPQTSSATVSICRLSVAQHTWLTGLAQVSILGDCTEFITDMADIDWDGAGESEYHSIYPQDVQEVDDGEGGTIFVTPPELHCVLAS